MLHFIIVAAILFLGYRLLVDDDTPAARES
jgi:hypothetical protein